MAWCHQAPSHYLNQCCLILNQIMPLSLRGSLIMHYWSNDTDVSPLRACCRAAQHCMWDNSHAMLPIMQHPLTLWGLMTPYVILAHGQHNYTSLENDFLSDWINIDFSWVWHISVTSQSEFNYIFQGNTFENVACNMTAIFASLNVLIT